MERPRRQFECYSATHVGAPRSLRKPGQPVTPVPVGALVPLVSGGASDDPTCLCIGQAAVLVAPSAGVCLVMTQPLNNAPVLRLIASPSKVSAAASLPECRA